jgi:hypothetical protein
MHNVEAFQGSTVCERDLDRGGASAYELQEGGENALQAFSPSLHGDLPGMLHNPPICHPYGRH